MTRSFSFLIAGMLLIAGMAPAQPRVPMSGRGMGEGPGPMAALKLTDEQRTKMSDLRVRYLKETEAAKADVKKQQSALRLELTAEKFSESRVKSIQSEIAKLQSELGWKRISHLRATRDLLTPEQQKHFDARVLSGGPGLHDGAHSRMQGGRGWGPGMIRPQHRGMNR